MGDSSGHKRPTIPDWQKNHIQPSPAPLTNERAPNPDNADRADAQLLEQAKQWLEDDSIRDAPKDRKVAFLEQKGLQGDDIQKLLDAQNIPKQESEMEIVHDSTSSSSITKAAFPPSNTPTTTSSSPTESREIPPIITYPEFLLRPEKPPPLVTFQRLAYTAYGFAGLAALTYGASNYLVQPMLESLTSARHELADTVLQNLEKLHSKLESTVSHVPYTSSSALLKRGSGDQDEEDIDSIDSDPTELFHRDIATQTSPLRSRSSSISSSPSLNHAHRDANPTSLQSTRLSVIHTSLTSLLTSATPSSISPNATKSLKSTVEDFQTYLDSLQFSNNSFNTSNYDHIFPGFEAQRTAPKKKKSGEDDEAEKFKAEIRAVKGALLSSRTFPAGRKAVGAGSAMGMVGTR